MLKYKIYVLFLFVLTLVGINYISAKNKTLPLLGKIIYIDPGHGGLDPGAMYQNIKEKDINLQISKTLENNLTKLGAIVFLSRDGDYDLSVNNTINRKRSDLSRRGNIINKSDCDLFLSIHLNAEDSGVWRGAQVFYNDGNKKNKQIAEILQSYFKKNLNSTREYKKSNDLYLQKRIEKTGVLIEVGFLSNPSDRYLLKQKSYHNRVSNIISQAIIEFFQKNS